MLREVARIPRESFEPFADEDVMGALEVNGLSE
jgi:hypothetical protein